jgi:hypothetical protein
VKIKKLYILLVIFLHYSNFLFAQTQNCNQNNVQITQLEFEPLGVNNFNIYATFEKKATNAYTFELSFKVNGNEIKICIQRNEPIIDGKLLLASGQEISGLTEKEDISDIKINWSTNSGTICPLG